MDGVGKQCCGMKVCMYVCIGRGGGELETSPSLFPYNGRFFVMYTRERERKRERSEREKGEGGAGWWRWGKIRVRVHPASLAWKRDKWARTLQDWRGGGGGRVEAEGGGCGVGRGRGWNSAGSREERVRGVGGGGMRAQRVGLSLDATLCAEAHSQHLTFGGRLKKIKCGLRADRPP